MIDQADSSENADTVHREKRVMAGDAELEEKARELQAFRDAGVLTKAELDEEMARARWRLA